ncbi:MAG TPA: NAD kinase [Tenuifilaceae bacterium]|nr:NAD kinase [Tenuifilaceae bacterium]HPE17889.1 NAD kinase [Tenuifilaceae bacterium]HPJ45366.1 NAD kinase [Tenuifilaceae bacterium]HPQ33607.1 NAD kinase [Tenuifilaceae bacterium]HRX67380.1 NAD kinase [Tenuifilaceae bacterium]
MVIALYGKRIDQEHYKNILILRDKLQEQGIETIVFEPFNNFLKETFDVTIEAKSLFTIPDEVKNSADLMLSIGGDGTFLESVSFIEDSCVPVAGINFGRLGFLAHISSNRITEALDLLIAGQYVVEERSVLKVELNNNAFGNFPYALNDITLQKEGTGMITIKAYINGEYLSTYWADGLIVATPTGSTAYSLSVGGPIITPNSDVFCISPIAPHHLTVRPLIIPDQSELILEATSRSQKILMSIDSQEKTIPAPLTITITKAPFCVGVVNINGDTYYKTLRSKLMWGADQRNF